MNEILLGVNWLAVVVGTVVAFLLGWLWYSPMMFGTRWARGIGIDPGAKPAMPVVALTTQLVATFLLAWVVGVTAAREALMTILLVVAALVALVIANGLFAKKRGEAIAIEAGFILAMAVVMIVVQGIF